MECPFTSCAVEAQRRKREALNDCWRKCQTVHKENLDKAYDRAANVESQGWRAWLRENGWRAPVDVYAARARKRYDATTMTVPMLMGDGRYICLTRSRKFLI